MYTYSFIPGDNGDYGYSDLAGLTERIMNDVCVHEFRTVIINASLTKPERLLVASGVTSCIQKSFFKCKALNVFITEKRTTSIGRNKR